MPDSSPRSTPLVYGLAMAFSLVGMGDALYLTVHHLTGSSVRCTVTHGCSAVLSSAYASFAGIPTAAYGLGAYFVAFSLATLAAFGQRGARTGLAVWTLPMLAASAWFVWLQAFTLHAFCQFCLLSTGTTLLLTVAAWVGKRRAGEAGSGGDNQTG